MDFINNIILNIFLILPFLSVGILKLIKNPVLVRNLCKTTFFFELLSISFLFLHSNGFKTVFLGIDIILDKISLSLLFLSVFVFFLFSFISKSFISNSRVSFYLKLLFLFALTNFVLLSQNIVVLLSGLFLIFLTQYFLSKKQDNDKKSSKKYLIFDLVYFLSAVFLISFEFLRNFIFQKEAGSIFSLISQNINIGADFPLMCALFGFLILIFRLFGFLPFFTTNLNAPNFIKVINSTVSMILGTFLLIKSYLAFDYSFYQYQNFIVVYLLLNLIYFCVLNLKQDKFLKFFDENLKINLIFIFFLLFLFENQELVVYLYSFFVIVLSYLFSCFVFLILAKKFNTQNINEFYKIDDKNRLDKFFIGFCALNSARVPVFPMFFVGLTVLWTLFSADYDSTILNLAPYCLLGVMFLSALSSFDLLYQVLIEPVKKYTKSLFSNHQLFVFWILLFVLFLLGFCFKFVIGYFIGTLDLEIF